MLAATLTAFLGSAALLVSAGGQLSFDKHDMFLLYWLLETLSMLLFAPLAYYFLKYPGRFVVSLKSDLRTRQGAIWCVLTLVLTVGLGALSERIHPNYAIALTFLFFPLLCWFVLAAKPASILTVIPLFAIVMVAFSLEGVSGLPQLETLNQLAPALLLLSVVTLLFQVIGVMNYSRSELLNSVRQQAGTDFLTGLANDRAFSKRIEDTLAEVRTYPEAEREVAGSWLVYVQVMDFDHLEDLMGFRASRSLEAMLAARLMGTCGPQRYPARLGNGIYSLLVEKSKGRAPKRILRRLYAAFDEEIFAVEGHQTRIRVTIGVVQVDGSLEDNNQYLSAANHAALMARDLLPRVSVVDNPRALIESRRNMTDKLEQLKGALFDERLVLFAQPIVPIQEPDDKLSYEILIRQYDAFGNVLSPGAFLPIAEAFGFMKQIDRWVVKRTCETLAANPEWLARTRKCSINLAGSSLSSTDILEYVTTVLHETGVPPDKIGFEVTETQHIQSRVAAEEVTSGLRRLGCGVALDDFGTGLASYDYLKTFEFDCLKIDGVFIRSIINDSENRSIVKAACAVARDMGLRTVAEFVETQDVAELLAGLGVDYGQGFGLGRPKPIAELFYPVDSGIES